MNIVNAGYDSTNYFITGPDATRLLIDVGWPGTLPKLLNRLKRFGIGLQEIKYLLVTHYHPDHAGLAQAVKEQGVRLIVVDCQLAAIPSLGRYIKPSYHYREITLNDTIQLAIPETRDFLRRSGIDGEIIHTPGHSDDSVSLILDQGQAFTGDLPNPMFATDEARDQVERSWGEIRARHVKMIYPAHGPVRPFE